VGSAWSINTNHSTIVCELAWRSEQICLSGQTIVEVVQQFNVRNRTQILIIDPETARKSVRRLEGLFRITEPTHFVDSINVLVGHEVLRETEDRERDPLQKR